MVAGKRCPQTTWFLDPRTPPLPKFDSITESFVTTRDGWLAAPTPELTAILDLLAAPLPGYGSVPFILDEDFALAQGLIRMAGAGKIVHQVFWSAHRSICRRTSSTAKPLLLSGIPGHWP
jgi:hypothetical protein